jgi:hypothetical protein
MFLHVATVEHLGGFSLRLAFTDGSMKDVDLSAEMHGEVFAPLADEMLFAAVSINRETGTIEWPNGADFAPEFLHKIGVPAGGMA